ncbi:MAG TPA: hypothetical protein VMH35_19440 [Streptosporangiaceae bacterium]|nr:hypothetical protein [Streptosporangiaceae bacterium]
MISQHRDYEDILRDALRAAAESVEPAVDGLERIRHRSHSRRSPGSTLARAAEWLRLYRIRLSVRLESLRWELSEEASQQLPGARSWPGRTAVMAGRAAAWLRPPAKPGHHGPGPGGMKPGRLGPAGAWLKPALTVGAVVAVVVGGVIALNRGVVATISPANSVTSPGRHHQASGATGLATPGLWQPPYLAQPSPAASAAVSKKNVTTVPAIACTPTPTPTPAHSGKPSASASPSASPTPSPSGSASVTPTPSPSDTGSPSATPSTGLGSTGPGSTEPGTAPASTMAFLVMPGMGGNPAVVTCGNKAVSPASTAPASKATTKSTTKASSTAS